MSAPSRRTATVLILALWLGALGWLAQRQYFGTGAGEDGASRWPVPPGSSFHAVRLADRQIGLTSLTVDTLEEGLRVTDLTTIELPPLRPGVPRRSSVRTEAYYTRGLQLRRWQTDLLTEEGRSASVGTLSGDTLVTLVLGYGTWQDTVTMPLRRPVILPSAITLVAASRGLPRTGDKLNLEVYDPVDQQVRTERLLVARESVFVVPDSAGYSDILKRWTAAHSDTVRAWRFDGLLGGLPVSRWVDASGMTVRIEYPLGAVVERSAFELVNSNFRGLPALRWDSSAAAPVLTPGRVAPLARRALTARLWLSGGAGVPDSLPGLHGGWQRRTGDTVFVAMPEGPSAAAPDSGGPRFALLQPDSAIGETARRIVGSEPRPAAAARALSGWVARTITLRTGGGTAPARLVLARKAGTGEERALLLVALARAAGLPARPVWGVVLQGGRWWLRAWTEVWADEWMPLDPTGPALPDAGRIRLGDNGQARLMDMLLRAGRVRLTVLEESE